MSERYACGEERTHVMTDMQPGPELDARVIEDVMGGTVYRYHEGGSAAYDAWWIEFNRGNPLAFYWGNGDQALGRYAGISDETDGPYAEDWSPSTDIKAAFEVLGRLDELFKNSERYEFGLDYSQGTWEVTIITGIACGAVDLDGVESAEHAICMGSLKAVSILKAVGAEVGA